MITLKKRKYNSNTLILVGSNSVNSINRNVAKQLQWRTDFDLLDLSNYQINNHEITQNKKGIPQIVKELKNHLQKYERFILFTPNHNGSVPLFLKNIFAWLTRAIGYKKPNNLNSPQLFVVNVSKKEAGSESAWRIGTDLSQYSNTKLIGGYGVNSYNDKKDIIPDLDNIINAISY